MKPGITFVVVCIGVLALASLPVACSSNNKEKETTPATEKEASEPAAPAAPTAAPTADKAAPTEAKAVPAEPDETPAEPDDTFDPETEAPPPEELASRTDCIDRQANVFKLTEGATWRKLNAKKRRAKLDQWAKENAESLKACQTADKAIVQCQAKAKDIEEYEMCRGG